MLPILAAAAAMACQPDPSHRTLPALGRDANAFVPKSWTIESRHAFDLNADGAPDLVLVVRHPDSEARKLVAAIATPKGLRNAGEGMLPGYPLGDANVEFNARGVLVVTDLVGGTTANQTVYRYRYEGPSAAVGAMRFIGMDIGNYSRTNQHDSTTLSYNYLTGGFEKRIDKLTKRGDYAPQKPIRRPGAPECRFLDDTPDPDDILSAELDNGEKR